MALYPGAIQRPIAPGSKDPKIKAVGFILHKAATNSTSLFGYFNGPSGGIESHFYIRKDGVIEQYRDTAWEADANYHGNSFPLNGVTSGYISIETQGLADDAWTDAQIAGIKKLLVWGREVHGIPLRRCKTPTDPGVGYHTMFGAPGAWTPVAKVCPGQQSINQFNNALIPWMEEGAPQTGAYDMQFTDPIPGYKDKDGSPITVSEALLRGNRAYYEGPIEGSATDKRIDAVVAALAGLQISPDATLTTRVATVEATLLKLKEALA